MSDRRYAASSSYSADPSEMELMPESISIEADGEYDAGADFDTLVDDEDLNAAFEAEHGGMFHVIDEVGSKADEADENMSAMENNQEKKRFVIPKFRQSEGESHGSGDEGKREWRRNERDNRSRDPGRKDRSRGSRDRSDRDRDERDRTGRDRTERERADRSRSDRDRTDREWVARDQVDGGRQDSREARGDRGKRSDERDIQNGRSSVHASPAVKSTAEDRASLFDCFAAEGLIPSESKVPVTDGRSLEGEVTEQKDIAMDTIKKENPTEEEKENTTVPVEDEGTLEIPMGRDSLVFVRDDYPWQVRVHPVSKEDMPRADFAQVWSMADSSSIVWSSQKGFGGVAEFLLKDRDSVQKFMRKLLWHNYASKRITVEITERAVSDATVEQSAAETSSDSVVNQAVFRFNNTKARQLIKTYYPTPKGEVTERSLYVNNVGTGVSADLMKAIFPCALKISVAKAGKEASSALVETESEDAAFHYLVVYNQIRVNSLDLMLSTVKYDWEGAREKFSESERGKKTDAKPGLLKTPGSRQSKRPSTTVPASGPAKKERSSSAPRGRGAAQGKGGAQRGKGGSQPGRGRGLLSRDGASRGRGGLPAPRGRGGLPANQGRPQGLLPDPVRGGSEGLLPRPDAPPHPPPLLAVPVVPTQQGILEADYMLSEDVDRRRTVDLHDLRQHLESQVLESHTSLVRAVREAEVEAVETELESTLAQLDHAHRTGLATRPCRPMDYIEEEKRSREPPRRTLLPLEGRPRMVEEGERLREPPRRTLLPFDGGPRMMEEEERAREPPRRTLLPFDGGPRMMEEEERAREPPRRTLLPFEGGPRMMEEKERAREPPRRTLLQFEGGPRFGEEEERAREPPRRTLLPFDGGPRMMEEEERAREPPRRTLLQFEGGPRFGEEEERAREPPRRTLLPFEGRPQLGEEEERPREPPRRTLLPLEGRPRMDHSNLLEEQQSEYRHQRPLLQQAASERDFMSASYSRERREEDYGDQRASERPRPYLLEAPAERGRAQEENDPYTSGPVYDYEHSSSLGRVDQQDRNTVLDDRRALLRRSAPDRERQNYAEERVSRGREEYDYDMRESRRPTTKTGNRSGYEEDSRQPASAPRYREDYDRRF